ncbi:SMc00767 family acetate metabolism repressor [Azospirillum sp. ST 5-10]|uniref:SMc00767 family acetate metabolism repressor n=1 Tax=unclassified Azospirillum TaxID=2630922 RepID=UPI003F4A4068
MSNKKGFQDAPPDEGSTMSAEQESAIRMMANNLHRLNEAVVKCVEAGITVELMRTARYHNEAGNWGDQLTPVIRTK